MGMGFGEKWFWVTILRGGNPITSFISGLIRGFWIPIVASMVFCFVTDPQWDGINGMMEYSIVGYFKYFYYFWYGVITITFGYIWSGISYVWNNFGEIARFWRHVLWLDQPEAFEGV